MARKFFLWVGLFSLVASGAQAASYQMTDGTIVDPIQYRLGGNLAYTGPNLEPLADLANAHLSDAVLGYADLADADLSNADLDYANLTGADLSDANLSGADLTGAFLRVAALPYANLSDANLTGADLSNANLFSASLARADFSNADLTEAYYLGYTTGSPYYNAETDFTNAEDGLPGSVLSGQFDPVAAGWTFVPEPSGTLLGIAALSCVGLLATRRRIH